MSVKNVFQLKYYLLFFVSVWFIDLSAQDCTGYHQYHCVYGDYTFFYSRQSKSLLYQKGETNEINIVSYGGEEYYFAVCAHRKFGNVQFKIMEDTPARTLLYDNASDNYSSSIIILNQRTRNLVIEVKVPEGTGDDKGDKRCVGLVIQSRKVGEVN